MKLEQLYKNGRNNQADCDNFLDHYYSIFETKIKSSYPNLDEDDIEDKMVIIAEMLNNLYKDHNNISFKEFDFICKSILNEIIKTFDSNYIKEEYYENEEMSAIIQEQVNYYLSQLESNLYL